MLILALVFSCSTTANEISLQVLGSGGPIADDKRASSGYVIRVNGHGRVLIDIGGGIFQRFGAAGLRMDELEFIGISHFHTDHSADFPALMKSAYFSSRARPLFIAGPAAAGSFPGLHDWLTSLLAPGKGAYAYLSGYIDGSAEPFSLKPVEVPLDSGRLFDVVSVDNITVTALPVPHGPVPSLAYKIQLGELVVVISGDQNLSDLSFVQFLKNADLWVMPMPIPENAGKIAKNLHAQPSKIGEVAATAGVKNLLLSHFMKRSLQNLEENVALVKAGYQGRVLLAEDLAQWSIGKKTGLTLIPLN